jgi:single-stranded DNA-binding protein
VNNEMNINIDTKSMIITGDPVTSRNADDVMQTVMYGVSHYWTRGDEHTNYFRVVAFGSASDIAQRLISEGSQILVSGPTRIREETDRPVTEFVGPPIMKVLPDGN